MPWDNQNLKELTTAGKQKGNWSSKQVALISTFKEKGLANQPHSYAKEATLEAAPKAERTEARLLSVPSQPYTCPLPTSPGSSTHTHQESQPQDSWLWASASSPPLGNSPQTTLCACQGCGRILPLSRSPPGSSQSLMTAFLICIRICSPAYRKLLEYYEQKWILNSKTRENVQKNIRFTSITLLSKQPKKVMKKTNIFELYKYNQPKA